MKALKNIFLFAALLAVGTSCSKEGCTDPVAINYSPEATSDNGICQYPTNVMIKSVTVEYPDHRENATLWDMNGSADTYMLLDDVTSEEILYETHRFRYSDTVYSNVSGKHVFSLNSPMEIEVVDRMPHFRVTLFDLDDPGDGTNTVSEEMTVFDFYDLSWYTRCEDKFPSTITMSGVDCRVIMEVEWGL